ncbi:replication initiation protein [Francisella noatunensis]|nr:replication initiation protein [Francisella noatunensis]NBH63920.1 replication initiation protein [Francisella noatunensis subsp. noatunensis]MBK2052310.1 replication initiation protein [Francisella noatunensis]MBK2053749.1 replication initiation protein [Francisella noatunensis]MBK2055248.1 replication initiation protein [Francisella noatunensis]
MMSRTLTVYTKNNHKDFKMYSWFSTIEYISSEACLLVKLHNDLKPYFLELKKEFTRANKDLLVRFKSKYTSRLYLLLKKAEIVLQHKNI